MDERRRASPKRVTSSDVATAAGVSRATVSFVLNNTPNQAIPADTRRRVHEAAARLSYRPSAEARALRRGRTDVVLLLLPPGLSLSADVGELVEQLSKVFAAVGLTVVVHPWTAHPAAEVWTAITPAAVIGWELGDEEASRMRQDGVRAVTSLTGGADPIGRWVQGRREDGIARRQVEILVDAGHVQLGYARPEGGRMTAPAALRAAALRRACRQAGVADPVAVTVPADPIRARDALVDWKIRCPGGSALCAHDSTTALAALSGLRRSGMSVPGDVAVVGVHDSADAALSEPPLTMVTVDALASARYVRDVVVALMEGTSPPADGPDVAGTVIRESL